MERAQVVTVDRRRLMGDPITCGHLRKQPRTHQIQTRHADDVAASEFADEVHHLNQLYQFGVSSQLLIARE